MIVRAHFAAADDDIEILQNTTYLCDTSGVVTITEDIRVPKELDDLPRLGFAFELPPTLERLVWFGRGPHESYPDRKLGAAFGRYESTVTDQYVPYVMPQEHGGHSDTRWFALHDGNGHGIHVIANAPFHFSASHFTADLTTASARRRAQGPTRVFVHLDIAHRGLGTLPAAPTRFLHTRSAPAATASPGPARSATPPSSSR
jgi:beta-galactosidase